MISFCVMESWLIREDRFWILTSRKVRDLGASSTLTLPSRAPWGTIGFSFFAGCGDTVLLSALSSSHHPVSDYIGFCLPINQERKTHEIRKWHARAYVYRTLPKTATNCNALQGITRHYNTLDTQDVDARDNVVYWKTNGKINNDLQLTWMHTCTHSQT